ncbi:hypothetical protein PC9H_006560 [Pleurotus ostreatus]|uniref:FMN hydroxy acid dehydrogenase domain-containing protein n=1 Tax=Pleurotus ostreatus TaxID=5322 RepID=A0A8H7DT01_PLEOS|nr:uncharacterized protein PC9H_006560 [Pleurotus ostreatus]KAF7430846.1 hypothetical protein PC9H_006560 [Pleurotus ostreatus]KAJ8695208.1 hypothetical protein PTI98_007823 [Pleurotus ostreatus]
MSAESDKTFVEATAPAPSTAVPYQWSAYMLEIYLGRNGPQPLGTVKLQEIVDKAREVSKGHSDAFDFVHDGAGTNSTGEANVKAFEKYRIVPRMLVDATIRSIETTIFGVKQISPLLIAPVGVQGIHHPDAELATAGAAGKVGVPFIMSTASSRSIEEVAQANGPGNTRWFQLYWPRTNEVTLSLLKRLKDNGFSVLVVTVDAVVLGWRSKDLSNRYTPYRHGFGIQVGTSDPVFMARFGKQPVIDYHPGFPYDPDTLDKRLEEGDENVAEGMRLGQAWGNEHNSGIYRTWEDLKFLRDNWDGPLVLKGIQSVQDAEMAVDYVDGIVVSNHGGRQVDGAIPSIDALDAIMRSPKVLEAQKSGKFTVLFDSGIRTGSDIIKAVALGAQGVLLGRPFLYGLMIAGQEGVEQILKQTMADLHISLGLSGWKELDDIRGRRDDVLVKLDF